MRKLLLPVFLLAIMARYAPAATMIYGEDLNHADIQTATWQTLVTLSSGSFTAGHDYLVRASAIFHASSSATDAEFRLAHGATPTLFTDSGTFVNMNANNQETNQGWLYIFTQPGTPENIVLEARNQQANNLRVDLAQISAMDLTGITYSYQEVTGDATSTASFVAGATVTFTPNGTDDYLIFGHGVVNIGTVADTNSNKIAIKDSVENLEEPAMEAEYEATGDIRSYVLSRVWTPSAASHTFTVDFAHGGASAHTILSSRIVALKLNQFAQHAFAYAQAEDALTATPTWTTTRTVSITPSVTGDYWIEGCLINDLNSTANLTSTRLQVAGSSAPAYGDDAPGVDGWDSRDEMPVVIGTVASLASGASRTINFDGTTTTGSNQRYQMRSLVAFSSAMALSVPALFNHYQKLMNFIFWRLPELCSANLFGF